MGRCSSEGLVCRVRQRRSEGALHLGEQIGRVVAGERRIGERVRGAFDEPIGSRSQRLTVSQEVLERDATKDRVLDVDE